YQPYTVQQGTVVNSLQFTGRVSPVQEQPLFFKSDGFVDQVFVQRGDQAQAGDVLAQLEITNLQNQLAQAQVALETAEIRLAQAEQTRQDALAEAAINREKIVLQLQQGQVNTNSAALIAAQIELDNAQQRLADAEYELQKSLDREWEPENLRHQYEQGVASAEDALRVAQARYNDALVGGSSSAVNRQLLEQDLALANLRLAQLERGIDPLLALEVERVRLEVEKIETQIADAQLIAPFDGEVLSLNVRAGSRAEAFQTAVILAQPQNLEITAELGSAQLNEMSVGQTAVIILRNRLDDPYHGVVRQLPYAFSGGTAGGSPQDTRARIQFDDSPADLSLGRLSSLCWKKKKTPSGCRPPPFAPSRDAVSSSSRKRTVSAAPMCAWTSKAPTGWKFWKVWWLGRRL
ncbi:MAG: biotin/lipoyl-binding protein, partial [Anaerolinea sp.]|nr:biotin/lipoyl-binding protein [Anaerolinea sp.]